MKKIFVFILMMLLVQTLTVSAAGGGLRTSVMGGLDGVIIDEIADSQFNSAQIANLGVNQIIFANSARFAANRDVEINLAPTIIYNLEDNVTIGGGLAYQRFNQNNFLQNRGMLALELDEKLTIGSRIGFNSFFSENNEDKLEFTLEAGGIYHPNPELTVESQLGINNYQPYNINHTETKLNLFSRFQIKEDEDRNIVGLIDLRRNDDDRVALGQNHYLDSGLFVYGGHLIFTDDIKLELGAGFEREVKDDLTLRVGQNDTVFTVEDNGLSLTTPSLSSLNFGASYEINQTSQVHLSYLPNITVGSNENNSFSFETLISSQF